MISPNIRFGNILQYSSSPSFKFRAFGESSIDLAIYFRGNKYGDQNPIIHEFIKRVHKRFSEEGIDIPFPVRNIINKASH